MFEFHLLDKCNHIVEDPGFCEGNSLQEAIEICEQTIKLGPISEKCKLVVPVSNCAILIQGVYLISVLGRY